MKRLAPLLLLALVACERATSPSQITRRLCGEVSAEAAHRCLGDLASAATDFEACAALPPSALRASCEKRLAIEARSAAQCARVVLLADRDACRLAVAVATDAPKLCEAIILPRPRRHCYLGLAKTRRAPDLCANIATKFEREQCMAQAFSDKRACATLTHPLVRARCAGARDAPATDAAR